MGALTTFLVLTVGLVAASAQFTSSDCGDVPNGAAIQNIHDCTGYMICQNGVLQSENCPSSYGFDPSTASCSLNSNCGNQISQNPIIINNPSYYPTPVSNNPQIIYPINNNPQIIYPINNNPQIIYPINNNPQIVYPINNNPQVVYPNNPQYVYPNNPQYGYPNNPQYVYPGSNTNNPPYILQPISSNPSGISSNPSSSSNPCYGAADGSYAPSATSCSAFYYCSQGQATLTNCPSGYSFNIVKSVCAPTSTPCN